MYEIWGKVKLISFGLLVADVRGFYKQTSGSTNSYKSIMMQNIFLQVKEKESPFKA